MESMRIQPAYWVPMQSKSMAKTQLLFEVIFQDLIKRGCLTIATPQLGPCVVFIHPECTKV